MKIYKSIVDNDMIKLFTDVKGTTLINHVSNSCSIEDVLAISNLFNPEIIIVEDCIFISEFYNNNIENLKEQFNDDRQQIEMFVNSWSLEDFFLLSQNDTLAKKEVIKKFGDILKYFWRLRFNELFPNRQIVVRVDKEIMGENGLTITVYQV
ncbi:hypothetical protein [Vallitalea guaymasensis]|uniref:hypothetical protein n=1 Tax=Vallitalea guaymasensis TaxID=1185412 RepID=UPI00272A71A8|nr:hypothetical protein [Vallitalea guaymasensis]